MNISLTLINSFLGLQTRVTFELVERLRRLRGLVGGTRGEILIPNNDDIMIRGQYPNGN